MPEISENTHSVGLFCVSLDLEMARKAGWSEEDIAIVWKEVSAATRAMVKCVARRQGHTRQCPDCECWTVPDGPCHRCAWDHRRSLASSLLQGWRATKDALLKLGMVFNNDTGQYEWPDNQR